MTHSAAYKCNIRSSHIPGIYEIVGCSEKGFRIGAMQASLGNSVRQDGDGRRWEPATTPHSNGKSLAVRETAVSKVSEWGVVHVRHSPLHAE